MADPITIISFVSVVWSLSDYGTKVVKRLNEFRANVRELPQAFQHISHQLPLLIDIVNHLHDQAKDGRLSHETETALRPVVEGIRTQMTRLDSVLIKVLPAARASTWAKGLKAIKSLGYEKTVNDFASVIDRYVSNLTAYQTTSNGALIKTLITLVEQTSLQAVSTTPPRKPCFMVRYETDEDFIGREDIMEEIRRRFGTENRVAITGIGGVGKSRIAIEYCFEYRRNSPEAHVFWIHGANKARFEAAYQEIARKLRLPSFDDSRTDTLQLVCDWLSDEDNGSWLMVLDNADDTDVWTGISAGALSQEESPQQSAPMINYIPRGSHGFILITTRDSQLGKTIAKVKKKPIDVLRFGPEQAEILLRRKLSEDDDVSQEDAKEVTEAMDYLPLAITQAAAYLDQNNMTVSKYLQLFRAGKTDTADLLKRGIHDPGRDHENPNSVFQTWKMSFDQISRQDPRSAEILSLMAMLDRQAISETLLQKDGESDFDFNAAIQKLRAFSLIIKETETSTFSMHRLVQLSVQKWLQLEHVIEEWQQKALAVIYEHCPPDSSFDNWAAWEAINPHVQVVLGYVFEMDSCLVRRASILIREADYRIAQGGHEVAHSKAMEALAICENVLGKDHNLTLETVNTLGVIYADQGKFEEAKVMYERALAGMEKTLDLDHVSTLATVNNLGNVYIDQGRLEEAETMLKRAVAAYEKVLGLDHELTLNTLSNLGRLYKEQGRLDEAKAIYERALAGKEKLLGGGHLSTLDTTNNLGNLFIRQNKFEEAEAMYKRALLGYEKLCGPGHNSTLSTVYNLGVLYREQGSFEEAEAIYKQALSGCEKVLGLEHKSTLDTVQDLGVVYERQDRFEEAETMFKRALLGYEKVLGLDYRPTLDTVYNLGVVYRKQDRFEEAEAIYKQALSGYEKVFGPDDESTLDTVRDLGVVYGKQGRNEEAEAMFKQALSGYEKVRGLDHKSTLDTVYNLGIVYEKQDRYEEAETMFKWALSGFEKVFGPDHESTLDTAYNLGLLYEQRGRFAEAEPMLQRVEAGESQPP